MNIPKGKHPHFVLHVIPYGNLNELVALILAQCTSAFDRQKMHFDELLGVLGEFGPYQKFVYFLVCLPSIIAAFHMVNSVFLLGIPKHR